MRRINAVVACAITSALLAAGAVCTHAGAEPLVREASRHVASAKPAEASYRTGAEAVARGDFAAAAAAFLESARLDPAWVAPLLGMADLALKMNRPEDAEAWLQKAEAVAPQAAEVRIVRGRFHSARGEKEKAEAAFKAAIAIDPEALQPRLDLAGLYLSGLWKPREAGAAYRAALDLEPRHDGAHYGLGLALSATGAPDEAIRELERAFQLAPSNPLAMIALGRLYLARKQYDKALDAFERGLGTQPNVIPLRVGRAEVLEAKGQIDEAIGEYETVLTIDPSLADVNTRLGSLYQRQRLWEKAEAAYLKAIESDPKNSIAYNNLAYMAADRGKRLDDALAWAEQAVRLNPAFALYQDTLGWVYRARGELAKAAEVLAKAAAADPSSADIQYHLGFVYNDQGEKPQAIAAFRRALEINSSFADAEDARRRLAAMTDR